ncbi:MAG: hypothetical protein ACKVG0_06020 [Alphaproteobacteria bacterium]|jgi:hypothetical protein
MLTDVNWVSELDEHGYNFLIDELVWHIEQGRMPVSVGIAQKAEELGYEFRFSESEPMFLRVNPEMLQEHWAEAIEIVRKFSQLEGMRFVHS